MALAFTGSGGLMTRLGHIFGGIEDINALLGGTASARVLSTAYMNTRFLTTLDTDYAASPAMLDAIDGRNAQLQAFYKAQDASKSYLAQLAANTIIEQVNLDTPLASQTLAAAMKQMITDMQVQSYKVSASTPSLGAQTSVGSPTGTPVIVGSVLGGNGVTLQYVLPETLTFSTTTDSQTGGTANREVLTVTSPLATANQLSQLWPTGSGISKGLQLVDALANNSTGNLLTNGDFETFVTTPNVPDHWALTVGVAGTDILQEASVVYGPGLNSINFPGTGTLTAIVQVFGNGTTGTAATLLPDTPYCLNFWIRSAGAPAAGTIIFELIDGSNTVIADDQSANNQYTLTQAGITGSFAAKNVVFRTPAVLPSTVKLRIRQSIAISGGGNYYVDRLSMTPMVQLYAGGPFYCGFSSNTKTYKGDQWTAAVTQAWASKFQLYFERVFGMRALGLTLSITGGNAISDALIT